ncbi:multiprotein-bridging factor 1 family protein [Kribbella sp. NPDC058245]|uniref:helix-turn-helix domain-containing protein n=1 Tax=Kribbella sp. NPDC058245 TaxID=3346399 RepID=UPI0036ECA56F
MTEARTETTSITASGRPAFGLQLRQCRQAAGLSLRQLAGRVGFDHSYLSQVERGQRPGSADLARRCDGELGTGDRLSETYRRTHPKPRPTAPAVQPDPLAAAWQQLAATCPEAADFPEADWAEWLGGLQCLPATQRLPELVRELSALQIGRQTADETRQTELSLSIAETLTACGRSGEARRWWWGARQLAEALGEPGLRSLVLSREVTSGLAEGRALPQLLMLADEAVTLAQQEPLRPDWMLRARSARARVLAELDRVVEAHVLLPQVLSHANELPTASTGGGWTPYEVLAVEGSVCASLGYWTAGCLMFARALELCPSERLEQRALLELAMAECFTGSGQGAAALATAMRVLIELPDEWHTTYVYAAAERVLTSTRRREPGLTGLHDLELLTARRAWTGRTVGSESSWGRGRE